MCEVYSKLTINTPQLHYWHRCGIFIVNFDHILKVYVKPVWNGSLFNSKFSLPDSPIYFQTSPRIYTAWGIKANLIFFLLPNYNYLFKVSTENTRTMCKICSKLTRKTPGVFIVSFEKILLIFQVSTYVTLSKWIPNGLETFKNIMNPKNLVYIRWENFQVKITLFSEHDDHYIRVTFSGMLLASF